MAVFRYKIKLLSSLGTPLKSDTLYGHLLCVARELDGEKKVDELIARFKGNSPPFELSSVFPEGMLPMPVLPGIPRSDFKFFVEKRPAIKEKRHEFSEKLFDALDKYKEFKKLKWLPMAVWQALKGDFSQEKLFTYYLENEKAFCDVEERKSLEPHNTIDRQSGTVLKDGGLFFSETTCFPLSSELDLYVRTAEVQIFEDYFTHLASTGYGRDRSTGKGHFSFRKDDGFDPSIFDVNTNFKMTLSTCSNMDLSGFKGYYSVFTKYGKVWDGFGENNPFKKPFIAFSEGSVFRKMPDSGYVLRNIHSNPDIVQITLPLTLPLNLEGFQ